MPTEGFPDEATLHRLVGEAPQMLPLAGSPTVTILGSEVRLGSGYVDLLAVESSGRPTVIEVKLARNGEARRAVVAQALAYGAYLHGQTIEELETGSLSRQLSEAGHSSILDAVTSSDQEGKIESREFEESLASHLEEGRFRIVFVLDEVPPELVRLVAYLEHVTDKLLIDLIAVGTFDVNGTKVALPQRVTPERVEDQTRDNQRSKASDGTLFEGSDEFEKSIENAPDENKATLRLLLNWARELEKQKLVKLFTYQGDSGRVTLLPRLEPEQAGLVTIWNDRHSAYLSFWRTVFERRCPEVIEKIEAKIAPARLGQGTGTKIIDQGLLDLLTEAYQATAN